MKNILKYMLGLVIFFGCIDGVSAADYTNMKDYMKKSLNSDWNVTYNSSKGESGETFYTAEVLLGNISDTTFNEVYKDSSTKNSYIQLSYCKNKNNCNADAIDESDDYYYDVTLKISEPDIDGNVYLVDNAIEKEAYYYLKGENKVGEQLGTGSFYYDVFVDKYGINFKSDKSSGTIDTTGLNIIENDVQYFCNYSFNGMTLTVVKIGNGKVEFRNNDGQYQGKIEIKESSFFVNGVFKCKDISVTAETCEYSDGTKRMYWKLASDSKQYCGGLKLTESKEHETTTTISEESTPSTWNATDNNTLKFAKKIYDIIKILIPVLVIVLSIVDFLKVLLISDEKNYKASFSKLIKRIILGIVFFAVPALIALLLSLSGLSDSGILNVFA